MAVYPFISRGNKLNSRGISRQCIPTTIPFRRYSFLLLELLIALFLTGMAVLPLAQLPMQATQEQIKSLYRTQSQQLADAGFAKLKEILYKNEISWAEIEKSSKEHILIYEDNTTISLPPLNPKKCKRQATLKCVSKKVKGTQQWWLMVARIEISPLEKKSLLFKRDKKKKNAKAFAYYLILHKTTMPEKDS